MSTIIPIHLYIREEIDRFIASPTTSILVKEAFKIAKEKMNKYWKKVNNSITYYIALSKVLFKT
jgi:hypothetical protein